ncbi:hypothetical protein K491DRAFT_685322 [Lophiostoma macrostomum CBS 122681]|uniref:Uncharacterized protein n=1 Tax=Lophiostoma macrostomum CBS 122681 TaxID=1314788 RepID=A0A6A6SIU9_9PLEO|nr:hypothetical protein K491DRAFT_685322 [Lophiostoma macrostomum CBS 122681]
MVKPLADGTIHRLAGLGGVLSGHSIVPRSDISARDEPKRHAWTLRSGVYTPRQVVEGFAPLLDTVVHRLGKDAPNSSSARQSLLDNVSSNLATDTRESTLPFPDNVPDISRKEIKAQADRIGKALVKWARETSKGPFEPDLNFRSPCENHLLTPANVELMFGRRSQPHLMQLFNEYMHQMVLLRDALLPFRNFDEVLLPVDGKAARGLRHLESPREQFLTTLVTKSVTQKSVLAYAKALLAPSLPRTTTGGYGFQYEHGTILPAVLSGGETHLHLLEYIPAKLDASQERILFDYEFADYYVAPRPEIPAGSTVEAKDLLTFPSEPAAPIFQNASLGLVTSSNNSKGVSQLELRLEFNNGKCARVDVGQIARGHRYSYQASIEQETEPTQPAIIHSALNILLHSDQGLLTAKHGGIHIVPTREPIVALALLGKLYPENVVLLPESESLGQTEKAGKGFEPKFIIWGGVKRGGLKGYF